jgi:hypothetical protein
MEMTSTAVVTHGKRLLAGIACGLTLLWVVAHVSVAHAQTSAPTTGQPDDGSVTATLAQCVVATEQTERAATFSGEMTAIAGALRMEMRIEVIERMPGETSYHPIEAPGLGAWHSSDPGVKTYKDLEQVTDLSAPAYYRALVRFRWLNPKGHVVKRVERRTDRCVQPAPATVPTSPPTSPPVTPTPPAGSPAQSG